MSDLKDNGADRRSETGLKWQDAAEQQLRMLVREKSLAIAALERIVAQQKREIAALKRQVDVAKVASPVAPIRIADKKAAGRG